MNESHFGQQGRPAIFLCRMAGRVHLTAHCKVNSKSGCRDIGWATGARHYRSQARRRVAVSPRVHQWPETALGRVLMQVRLSPDVQWQALQSQWHLAQKHQTPPRRWPSEATALEWKLCPRPIAVAAQVFENAPVLPSSCSSCDHHTRLAGHPCRLEEHFRAVPMRVPRRRRPIKTAEPQLAGRRVPHADDRPVNDHYPAALGTPELNVLFPTNDPLDSGIFATIRTGRRDESIRTTALNRRCSLVRGHNPEIVANGDCNPMTAACEPCVATISPVVTDVPVTPQRPCRRCYRLTKPGLPFCSDHEQQPTGWEAGGFSSTQP